MNAILAAAIIFVIFAIGDAVSTRTKAIVSSLLVASVLFLAGFWTGIFPTTLFADSTILSMAGLLVTVLLVHLGTIIKLRDFGAQWRTVIVAAVACMAISAGVYFIGSLIVDRGFALTGAPILSGGVVATLMMTDMASSAGRNDLAVFATLVMCAQGFVGYPVASLCLRSEGKRLQKKIAAGEIDISATQQTATLENSGKKLLPALPDKYNGPNVILAKLVLVALLACWVSGLFNNVVNKLVWCLVFGVLLKELGFLDEDSLGKAKASGLVMPVITLSIFTNLAAATPDMVGSMLLPLLIVIVVGVICFTVASILIGKLFHYSWQMSMAIGASCLFGFPGTLIVSNEVSNATGNTPEEKKYINEQIMPKMLIAGMVTVSITSVLIAGVMSKWL
jgi:ABC-type multidrug transport system fused ATPase/permease subunit